MLTLPHLTMLAAAQPTGTNTKKPWERNPTRISRAEFPSLISLEFSPFPPLRHISKNHDEIQ